MEFKETLDALTQWLQTDGRVSRRAIKRQFDIDDDFLEDLIDSLIYAHNVEADDRGVVWNKKTNAPQGSEKAERPFHPGAAERRQLTVMFCDLADSTGLAQSLDPEDLRDVIRQYQQAAAEVIHGYGGHVAQYLGDGLLVYFGWPRAHEDDARRSILAAIKIIENINREVNPDLASRMQVELTVRIGIHTGLVVIGEMGGDGRYESLATGDAVNIAARLEGLAGSNGIVISGQTLGLLGEEYFHLQDMGLHELKGIREPMPLYRVKGLKDVRPDRDERRTELIGRDREVELLQSHWNQVKSGKGHGVMVSGIAGIGKSTLVSTLKASIRADNSPCLTLRCSPYHVNSALYPVSRLIDQVLGFDHTTSVEGRIMRMHSHLEELGLPHNDHAPLLLRLLSIEDPIFRDRYATSTPQKIKQLQLDAIVSWFYAHAIRAPLLIVWDDLHWADPTTLELIGLVQGSIENSPVMSVMTFRPEFEPPWQPGLHLSHIVLSRLTNSAVKSLISQITPAESLPETVVEHIIKKTDGVPIFVEELTRMLLESDVLVEEKGVYQLTGPIDRMAVPNTIRDSLLARLDQLGKAKAVAQVASIIGREFEYEQLKALSNEPDEHLQQELDQLESAELLLAQNRAHQKMYMFRHALVQDAAYSTLLKSRRQALHGRFAGYLTEHRSDLALDKPEVVAHHLNASGQHAVAIDYWLQAARASVQNFANTEAIAHAHEGLRAAEWIRDKGRRDQLRLQLYLALGWPMLADKGPANDATGDVNRKARQLAIKLGDRQGLCSALFGLSTHYVVRAEHDDSVKAADELREYVREKTDPLYPAVAATRGMPLFCLARFREAGIEFETAISQSDVHIAQGTYEESPMTGLRFAVWSRAFGSHVRWQLGNVEGAIEWTNTSVDMASEMDEPYNRALSMAYAAITFQFTGDTDRVLELSGAAADISSDQGFPYYLGWSSVLSGWAVGMQGNFDDGVDAINAGLQILNKTGNRRSVPYYLGLLSEVYAANGFLPEALDTVNKGLAEVKTINEFWWLAELLRLKGEYLVQFAEGPVAEAKASFESALSTSRSQGATMQELRALCSLARLAISNGEEGRKALHRAMRKTLLEVNGGASTRDVAEALHVLDLL